MANGKTLGQINNIMRNLFLKSVFSTRKKLAALIALAVLL